MDSWDSYLPVMLPRQVLWTEGVAGAARAKRIARPGKAQGVMGGGTKARMAELRRRWGVEAESSLVR